MAPEAETTSLIHRVRKWYGDGRAPWWLRVWGRLDRWWRWERRRWRRHPIRETRRALNDSIGRLAIRLHPEASEDIEDCSACYVSGDMCVYHRGAGDVVLYVNRIDPEAAARLFPES